MKVRAGAIGLTLMTVAAAATPPPSNPATLLKAINFALLGTDGKAYVWKSTADCVVISEEDAANYHSTEVLHLNNVDASRIRVEQYSLSFKDGHVEHYVKIELHGEDVIREYTLESKAKDSPLSLAPSSSAEYSYTRETLEYERMVRAWKYIYSHGCTSARSSF